MADDNKGASNNERLLAAARTDNEDLLLQVFESGDFDINCQDGLGNTPLHVAVQHGSTDVLEQLLSHEDCDMDPKNRIARATPLHLAVQLEPKDLRLYVVESLLEAGADISIKDKNGDTAIDLVLSGDESLHQLFRKYKTQNSIAKDDIANDNEEDDDEFGSGSDDE